MYRRLSLATLLVVGLTGCLGDTARPDHPENEIALTAAPEACSARAPELAPKLRLPRTETPVSRKGTDPTLELAQVHTVNQALEQAGVWTDFDDGWSLLALELRSDGARALAVRLRDTQLPRNTAVWICSADKRVRQGPYSEATDGELWTPVVPGNRALLHVWVPTAQKSNFRAQLADVYGSYR
jgi:hypothetical protein